MDHVPRRAWQLLLLHMPPEQLAQLDGLLGDPHLRLAAAANARQPAGQLNRLLERNAADRSDGELTGPVATAAGDRADPVAFAAVERQPVFREYFLEGFLATRWLTVEVVEAFITDSSSVMTAGVLARHGMGDPEALRLAARADSYQSLPAGELDLKLAAGGDEEALGRIPADALQTSPPLAAAIRFAHPGSTSPWLAEKPDDRDPRSAVRIARLLADPDCAPQTAAEAVDNAVFNLGGLFSRMRQRLWTPASSLVPIVLIGRVVADAPDTPAGQAARDAWAAQLAGQRQRRARLPLLPSEAAGWFPDEIDAAATMLAGLSDPWSGWLLLARLLARRPLAGQPHNAAAEPIQPGNLRSLAAAAAAIV